MFWQYSSNPHQQVLRFRPLPVVWRCDCAPRARNTEMLLLYRFNVDDCDYDVNDGHDDDYDEEEKRTQGIEFLTWFIFLTISNLYPF